MRTQLEIVARLEDRQPSDFFGFECGNYILALTFDHAKPFLKDDVTEWEPSYVTDEQIREEAIEYMSFAWEKAINCRGLSAGRSLNHYTAWLWLLGDDEIWPTLEDYEFYGKDQLRVICDFLEIDPDQWDDGVRVNS